MKFYKQFLVLLFLLAGLQNTFSQTVSYTMTLQNAVLLNPSTFQFDIYIVSTGANFNLTSYQTIFTYNSALVNGGTLTFNYIGGSSALSVVPQSAGVQNDPGQGNASNLRCGSSVGSQVVSTTPLKVGTYQISNTVAFGTTVYNNITWDFTGMIATAVNANTGGTTSNVTNSAFHVNALSPYIMNLQNGIQSSPTSYSFDVYIASSSVNFTLTSYQVVLTFSSAIVNGGTLSLSYVAASCALPSCTPLATQIASDAGTQNLLIGSNPGSDAITLTPVKVGTFTLTNTVPFSIATPNITWDFAGAFVTSVNLNNTNVTVQANHQNSLANTPLPVELTSFSGTGSNSEVVLTWNTATEVNNYGFEIERSAGLTSSDWTKVGFVKGHGNSNSPKDYSFTDSPTGDVEFQYRLKQIDFDGRFKYYDAITVKVDMPASFALHQNFPNPFNPTTNIKFDLPKASKVTLKVFNILGEEITTLIEEVLPAGHQEVAFDGSRLSSGMYIYQIKAGNYSEVKKMLLMK